MNTWLIVYLVGFIFTGMVINYVGTFTDKKDFLVVLGASIFGGLFWFIFWPYVLYCKLRT